MATLGVTLLFLRLCFLAWTLQVATSQRCEAVITASPSNVVQFGDQLLLYCAPAPGVSGSVSWTKHPSMAIMASGVNPCHCTAVYNDTSASVFLNVTDDTDVGLYECNLQVSFSVTCMERIQVIKAVIPVLTPVINTNQTASQGSNVTFSVNSTNPGLPLANVVWSKNGVSLSNTSNMVVTNTMLQLSNIQAGDRGQYVVTATNKVGSNSISFNLYVQFYPVVNMSVITSGSQTMVQCDAYGYPTLTEVTIQGTSSTSNIYSQDVFTFTGRASTSQSSVACSTPFYCRASNSVGMTTVTSKEECVGVNAFSVKPVGSDGAFLQWTSANNAPTVFQVLYRLTGSSLHTLGQTMTCQTCNSTINGLIRGGTYSFVIGYGSQQSQAVTTIIGSGLGAVTMVTATVVDSLSSVVSVVWSPTPYASGYLLYVNYGMGGAFIVNVTGGSTSASVGVKCRALNTLQVQAYNSSAFSSLSPEVQAYTYCSPTPAIKSVTTDNSILRITFTNVESGTTNVTAVQDDGFVYVWKVILDANGMACLAGLPQGAGYTMCAYFNQGSNNCYPDKISVGKGDPIQSCTSTLLGVTAAYSSTDAEPTAGSSMEPLLIGIIIVATFAGVATVFCIVGLLLACRKRKTSDYDISSSACTSMKDSPTPPEVSAYSHIDTSASHGKMDEQAPQSYNMTARDVRSPPGTYNKTFNRTWSDSYMKSQQGSDLYVKGSCATAV